MFQAACIAVLVPFGVSASQGLAYGLILQAVEIVAAVVLGVPALLREGLSVSELRRKAVEVEEAQEHKIEETETRRRSDASDEKAQEAETSSRS